MSYRCSAITEKAPAPSMSANGSAWWRRWRDVGPPTRVQPMTDLTDYGSENVLSTFDAYRFFWGAQRINAPGYADQNWYSLSKQYTSQIYLAIRTLMRHFYQSEAEIVEVDEMDRKKFTPVHGSDDVVRFLEKPNPKETFADLLEQYCLQKSLTGMGAWWTPWELEYEWDRPNEMYVLSTASLIPQPLSPLWPNGAWLVQPWLPAGPYAQIPTQQGVGTVIPAEQICMVKEAHPFFRWVGYSPIWALAAQADVVRSMDVSRANAQKYGLNVPFMLTFDNLAFQPNEKQMERLRQQLINIYGGPENAGKPFIAPPFAKLTPTSNKPSDMEWVEGWEQLLTFTLAFMGMNRAVAGLTNDTNFATMNASLQSFYHSSLDPELMKPAGALTYQVLQPWYGKNLHLKLKGRNVVDKAMDLQFLNALARIPKAMKIGEVRKMAGLPPSDHDDEWIGEQPPMGGAVPGGMGGAPDQNPFAQSLGEVKEDQNIPQAPALKSAYTAGEEMETLLEQLRRRGRAVDVKPNGRTKSYSVPGGKFYELSGRNGKH